MLKRLMRLLVSVGLMAAMLIGCGKKVPTADSFKMDEATVVLSEVTEDVTDWRSQLTTAKGKWVRVVLTITEGDIEFSRVKEMIITNKEVLLDDDEPETLIASGVTIKNTSSNNMSSGTAYAVGTIHVFYDVNADFDVSKAKVTVNGVIANVIPDAKPAIGQ